MRDANYTAIVLNTSDRAKLLGIFAVPEGFDAVCHHMTINLGGARNGPAQAFLGQVVKMKVMSIASNDKVIALGVETNVPSVNFRKHITFAVNKSAGGKPKDSNQLYQWDLIPSIEVSGVVTEVWT